MTAKSPKFDLDYLRTLVDFMKETDLDEVEVSETDSTIRLRRNMAPVAAAPIAVQTVAEVQAPAAPAEPVFNGHVLKSPMVGTFYRATSPEADPFVSVGDKVKKGQTICIIEAMKTMNQVEADKDGVIGDILIENAQPVEFGHPLFVIN
tara:strand:+ start:24711 stop:25157 length:447 start_codon:yes stop_codon:yes gene_type:complete